MTDSTRDPSRDADEKLKRAEELLRFNAGDRHVEPLDDISRRRAINAALEEAAQPPVAGRHSSAEELARAKPRSRRTARVVALAAAAAVVAALITGAAALMLSGTDAPTPSALPAVADDAAPLPVSVLLAAGEAADLTTALVEGQHLAAGRTIAVGDGQVAVGVSDRMRMLVDARSRATIVRCDESVLEIGLEAGRLLLSVEPGTRAPELIVSTPSGRVRVTGTVFSVETAGERADVRVYRGTVRVESTKLAPFAVQAPNAARFDTGEVIELQEREVAEAVRVAGGLELLSSSVSSQLQIRSVPAGAAVLLDEEQLGTTPIAMAVRPGYRRLSLALEDHAPVHEQITLARGESVERVFEMEPAAAVATLEESSSTSDERPGGVKPAPDPDSAETLLARAQSLRKARDWRGAARAYRRLMADFPASGQARTARVSLGVIQLHHLGQPRQALSNFDAYLVGGPSGALVPEAIYGRASAFRALGRPDLEVSSLRDLIARFPASLRAQAARKRLTELDAL